MAKLTTLLAALLLTCACGYAQTSKVSGTLSDTTQKKPVHNAVVMLLTPKDSVLYRFTRTDVKGDYHFDNVKDGDYIQMITHPYFADVIDNVVIKGPDMVIPPVAATSKSKLMQEVIVKSGNPIRIKGDTTIYTADSFKVSANANVEELLKKLPGIQVDKNGTIKAMGQTVEKVLVDGEEFFGDDPGMAVKNLRADAVKEVQVFDKKSDQAEFTGIDDGNTKKTINLKMKEDRKKGYFGKVDVSGGLRQDIDHRYNNNLMFSSFKGKRKISAFFLNGNTGQDGLSWQDSEKFGGENENFSMSMDDNGEVNYTWTGGSSDDEPYVNTENGFIRNVNAGVQYSNKWNDKHTLNFTPKYNSQIYTNDMSRYARTQISPDSMLIENAKTSTNVNRNNIKTNLVWDYKIDSMNSFKLTARANFYHTESEELQNSSTTGESGNFKNSSNRKLQTETDKQSFAANLLFKHKFKKARRTISWSNDWNLLTSKGDNFLRSYNEDLLKVEQLDQYKDNDKSTQRITSRLVYTEPFGMKYSMELAYELGYTNGKNNQVTYNYNPISQKYDEVVDTLTNDFTSNIIVNKPSLRFNYAGKKLKYNFGAGFGFTHFDLADNSFNKDYIRNFTNFFPSATLNYNYKSQANLRFNYNGYTQQPSINQLQPLRNNNNYFNQYIGNPDLKPSFTNSFNLSHNSYNFIADRWMYQSLNVRFTSNSINNNRVYDEVTGKTTTQPINTNGNMSIGLWSGLGFKMKKIDARFNISPHVNYNKSTDVINNQVTYSKTLGAGLGFYASKSKDKKYDVSISNDFNYNSNTNTQRNTKNHYNINNLSADVTVYFFKTFSINTDYNFYSRGRLTPTDKVLNNHIWNARVQKTFKKDEFTLYFKVRDILNQNIGIDRNFSSTSYTETTNDRLKRYWLLGFAWNFKNGGAKAK